MERGRARRVRLKTQSCNFCFAFFPFRGREICRCGHRQNNRIEACHPSALPRDAPPPFLIELFDFCWLLFFFWSINCRRDCTYGSLWWCKTKEKWEGYNSTRNSPEKWKVGVLVLRVDGPIVSVHLNDARIETTGSVAQHSCRISPEFILVEWVNTRR